MASSPAHSGNGRKHCHWLSVFSSFDNVLLQTTFHGLLTTYWPRDAKETLQVLSLQPPESNDDGSMSGLVLPNCCFLTVYLSI